MRHKTNSLRIRFFLCVMALIAGYNLYFHWAAIWTPWAKFYTRDQDVIVSFTTTPTRIGFIKDTLGCLDNQTFKPRQIYLSIPHRFKRDNSEYVIPEWLLNYPNLTILRTQDYGPATKLLGALENAEIRPETIIITVDDDSCYPPNTILQLVTRAKRYPQAAVGHSGVGLNFDGHKDGIHYIDVDNQPAIILEGYAGVAYRPQFFDKSIFEILKEPNFCFNSDDLYISFHLAKNNIPRRTVHTRIMNSIRVNQYITGMFSDALHNMPQAQGQRYKACCAYLQAKYPQVGFNEDSLPSPLVGKTVAESKAG